MGAIQDDGCGSITSMPARVCRARRCLPLPGDSRAAEKLDVVHGRLVAVIQRVTSVIQRRLCRVQGSDQMVRVGMPRCIFVMLGRGIMMIGRCVVVRCSVQMQGSRDLLGKRPVLQT